MPNPNKRKYKLAHDYISTDEDFYIDEAISTTLDTNPEFSEFEIPIMKDPDTYIYQPEVKTVEWISKDRIVISYETGCLRLYYADGSKPPTFLKQYENGVWRMS